MIFTYNNNNDYITLSSSGMLNSYGFKTLIYKLEYFIFFFTSFINISLEIFSKKFELFATLTTNSDGFNFMASKKKENFYLISLSYSNSYFLNFQIKFSSTKLYCNTLIAFEGI